MMREMAEATADYHRRQAEIWRRAEDVALHTIMRLDEAYSFVQIGLTPEEERLAIHLGTQEGSDRAILNHGWQIRKMRGSSGG